MFGYIETDLKLIYNLFYLILLIIASGFISYFLYRKTTPPVSPLYKTILVILRTVALTLIFLIFFEPIFSITRKVVKKVSYKVLVDNSVSSGITDNKYNRKDVINSLLSGDKFSELMQTSNVDFYYFSNNVKKADKGDTLEFMGEGTNISEALKEVSKQDGENDTDGIILISDGIFNLGEDPVHTAERLDIPVYTVGIGDSASQKDLLVKNVTVNQISYINKKLNVDVLIKNIGFEDEKSTITISDSSGIIKTRMVELPGNKLEKVVSFELNTDKEGLNEYKLSLMPLAEEKIVENNHRSFFVKVLRNKIRLLLIGGRTDPDFGFLVRSFSKNEDIDLTSFVEKKNGELFGYDGLVFPENLNEFDVVFFMFYPTGSSLIRYFEILRNGIEKRNLPLFVIVGKKIELKGIDYLRNLIPLKSGPTVNSEFEAFLKLTDKGKNHPLTRLMELNSDNLNIWKNLPPLYYSGNVLLPENNHNVLAAVDNKRNDYFKNKPEIDIISCSVTGDRKYIFINGYGLWRWDMLFKNDDDFSGVYDKFFRNGVRWLINREEEKKVRIYTDKEAYNSSEEVLINAEVYDDYYNPIDNAEVKIKVSKGELVFERILTGRGKGIYQKKLEIIEPGNYSYKGDARFSERIIGEDSGEFTFSEFSMEMLETRMRNDILQGISNKSSGKFYYAGNVQNLFEDLSHKRKEFVLEKEIEIYNKWILMIIIITLLFGEWFIRKRLGML